MGRISKRTGSAFVVLSNREMVNEYFRLITKKDVRGLMRLFDEDAVVFEPFSNVKNGLVGRTMIENFLKVVVMANAGLKRTIRFVDECEDRVTAIVTFELGDSVTGKFTFNFVIRTNSDGVQVGKKIGMLRIEFIEDF
ncbi:MAG TPA: nuclear transport factor 2 family protein [Nitrososphaera sp.]|nr:nuclear transport factor 2 family protein [Nitrososphaera sp.]